MNAPIAKVSTDSTGLIVTFQRGTERCSQFVQAWAGYGTSVGVPGANAGNALQIVIGGTVSTIASVQSGTQLTLLTPVQANGSNLPMVPNRETVYQALFNLISQSAQFTTVTRVPQIWANITPAQCPYLWQDQAGENQMESARGMPYKWEFDVLFGLYTYSGDPQTIAPVTLLNPILDAIETQISPNQTTGQGNTLNGLVYEVRLLGKEKGEAGALVNNAWAAVPAVIRVL
jgi:hypothetical protein